MIHHIIFDLPYIIVTLFSCDFTDAERGAIALGFNDIEKVSCAKFRPATTADKEMFINYVIW